MPTILDILDKKRHGAPNSENEIHSLVEAAMRGDLPDYQLSAWLMAVCIQGMSPDETTWLTDAFVRSGDILNWDDVPGIVADKHSTGGVGDKTTLALVPLLAAAGLCMAKLSGRGLGFTGGTIDKLEAIPGFRVSLDNETFLSQLRTIGMAISSQTPNLAPADGKFYALRDVTATVESIPLIAASVVSKKIAAGAKVIVLDIKAGRGAFMKSVADATALAGVCREVGKRLGRRIAVVISGMETPLGYAVGHSLEVMEAIQTLRGEGPPDLERLCLKLGAVALCEAGLAANPDDAEKRLQHHLRDGSALEKFRDLIRCQGGNPDVIDDFSLFPQPRRIERLLAGQSGYIADIDPLCIAKAAKSLGAGRERKESPLDLSVGVRLLRKPGDPIEKGDVWAELYINPKSAETAEALMREALRIQPDPPNLPPLIYEIPYDFSHA